MGVVLSFLVYGNGGIALAAGPVSRVVGISGVSGHVGRLLKMLPSLNKQSLACRTFTYECLGAQFKRFANVIARLELGAQ